MIRLLVADDHQIVREGLKRILLECPDIQVAGEATDGDDVLTKAREVRADVLLLDVSMPGPGVLGIIHQLRKERPALRILVLSVHPEQHYAVRTIRAGASGYVTKDRSSEELVAAIRRVYTGGKYVSPSLAEHLASTLGSDIRQPAHETLSDREYEVFLALGSGKTVKTIAAEMTLSPKTVSTYRTRIFHKMKFTNSSELIRYAVLHDLVS